MQPISPSMRDDGVPLPEIVYAKDQPEYIPLPVVKERNGTVTSRWKLTWKERLSVLFGGSIYLQIATFNRPLQPVRLSVEPLIIKWEDCVRPMDAEKAKQN